MGVVDRAQERLAGIFRLCAETQRAGAHMPSAAPPRVHFFAPPPQQQQQEGAEEKEAQPGAEELSFPPAANLCEEGASILVNIARAHIAPAEFPALEEQRMRFLGAGLAALEASKVEVLGGEGSGM